MPRRPHFAILAALLSALLPAVLLAGAPISAVAAPARPAPPTPLPTVVTKADKALAQHSLRKSLTREQMYFVMADRFANGSSANDAGGLTGGRLETGLDLSHKGFYHGGDLVGLTNKLDYILGLGTTAIWLTPAFKNQPVQGSGSNASAGYHGYWVTDFTQIDPHLGTNADMSALITAAHAKGMKVFFDIITNHTADVIDYEQKQYSYLDKADHPYTDASGKAFDDRDFAGTGSFPKLDTATSFPYTPTFRSDADKVVKVPSWLNDPGSTTTAATRRSPERTASTATSSVSTTCSPSSPRSSRG